MPYFGPFFAPPGTSVTPPPSGDDTAPAVLATAYCTDEDIAKAAAEDFAALAPRAPRLAAGVDGVFASASRWVLTSATNAFASQGCGPNRVCVLGPEPKANFGGVASGVLFAINAATDGGLQLRHIGLPLGSGPPPSPAGGLTSVRFAVPTFAADIDWVSREANYLYGIDPDIPGRRPVDLKPSSLADLRQWAVQAVLRRAYTAASKSTDSDYKLKLALATEYMAKLHARLALLWGPAGDAKAPTGPGSGRVIR